jgi:ribonucleoside-diphosphate reductase alpha chain
MTEGKVVYEYCDALKQSIEYFGGEELSAKVFLDKYALRDENGEILEDTPDKMHRRLAKEFARIEKDKFKKPLTEEDIYNYFKDFKYIIPGGSGLSGIGNKYKYVSLSNCFVGKSPLDSYSSICKTDEEIVSISKRRGGIGFDVSNLRPQGSPTSNASNTSTGIVSFCERYSNTIMEVGQAGRRGALILTISIHHPEVVNFIKMKQDLNKVNGANISVRLTDEFLEAVENDKEYEQRWPVDSKKPKISNMIKAKEIWDMITESAWKSAEPGILLWNNIIKESPADCYPDFQSTSTNPCSELPLSERDSCRLLLLNSYSFVENPFTKNAKFNFDKFYNYSQVAQRLMDDLIDLEIENIDNIIKKIQQDPEPIEIKRDELSLWKAVKKSCQEGRRTGTGLNAIGDTIAACGLEYGSKKSIDLVGEIFKTLKIGCYRSSVDMAKEIGAFKVWEYDLEKNNPFLLRIKEEDPTLYKEMKKYGRRNIGMLTMAPSGSVSILTKTTSGIEPLFQTSYVRRKKINVNDENIKVDFVDNSGDRWQNFEIFHPKIKEWEEITKEKDITKSPWYGCCAEEIDWNKRVLLQATANKHIDHSISSTLNLPEEATIEDVSKIYIAAWKYGCKGITVYRKNCRTGVLIDGDQEKKKLLITKTSAPKRPKELPGDLHHVSVKGSRYFVLVGIINGQEPYEVFAGNEDMEKLPRQVIIRKKKRNTYCITNINTGEILFDDISKKINDEEEALTRMISLGLRHGADITFITHQLEKTNGDMLGFSKAVSRVLKKYIKEGSMVHGESCPECGGELRRAEGCVACTCGFSRCG